MAASGRDHRSTQHRRPQDGVKPREILLHKENVDVFFARHQDGDLEQG
jgi:hypothetical protein